jgi:Glycosyl transferases group 1
LENRATPANIGTAKNGESPTTVSRPLRIFLCCQQALRRHAVPAYAFWEVYFKNGLSEAGHNWLETPKADWAEGLTALSPEARIQWREKTWTQTVAYLREEHARRPVDLFLSYLFPHQVEPGAVRTIHDLGIPCVNFFCDNVREFTRIPETYRAFDLHWVPEAEARSLYAAAGLAFVYAPMPVWIPLALRTAPENENDAVVFIGSHDSLRDELLGQAVAGGLPLRVYGDNWRPDKMAVVALGRQPLARKIANQMKFWREYGLRGIAMRATYRWGQRQANDWHARHCQPPIYGEAYLHATRESQIVIGINRYPSFRYSFRKPHCYSRLRDIEAPMLGACYLTEWAPGLDDLYELGAEIETYRDAGELSEKARALAGDPPRRKKLRAAGQQRALHDHSVSRTIQRIAERLNFAS